MKQLCKHADTYAKEISLPYLGLIKVCACAAGVIGGLCVPKKNKKSALAAASIVFSFTFFPLMFKIAKIIADNNKEQ